MLSPTTTSIFPNFTSYFSLPLPVSQFFEGKSFGLIKRTNLVKNAFGEECACFYAMITEANPDQQRIREMRPQFEAVLKSIEIQEKIIGKAELPGFGYFKQMLAIHIGEYFHELSSIEKKKQGYSTTTFIKTEDVFQLFFNKLLDTAPIEPRHRLLEGCSNLVATRSIVIDLIAFHSKLQEDPLRINDAMRIYQIMHDFALTAAVSRCLAGKENEEIILKNATEFIYTDFKMYSEQIQVEEDEVIPSSIIIPGGYENHAALYQIKRNELGSYNFSIINTGNSSVTVVKKSEKKSSLKSLDVVYTGITEEELSENFFLELLRTKNASNMNEIYAFLDGYFSKKETKKINGFERTTQKRGTCTVKCIKELLKTELGTELYREFFIHMGENAIKSVEEKAETISSSMLKIIFPVAENESVPFEFYQQQLTKLITAGKSAFILKKIKYHSLASSTND